MMVPPLRHCGTTYDILIPLLRNIGTTVTSRRYHCYDILTRHAGITDRQYAPSKRWWLFTSRHGVTSQKNSTSSSYVQTRWRAHARTHTNARTHIHTRIVAFDIQTQHKLPDVIRHCYRPNTCWLHEPVSTSGTTIVPSEIRNMQTLFYL
jgi:hypothetical protein